MLFVEKVDLHNHRQMDTYIVHIITAVNYQQIKDSNMLPSMLTENSSSSSCQGILLYTVLK